MWETKIEVSCLSICWASQDLLWLPWRGILGIHYGWCCITTPSRGPWEFYHVRMTSATLEELWTVCEITTVHNVIMGPHDHHFNKDSKNWGRWNHAIILADAMEHRGNETGGEMNMLKWLQNIVDLESNQQLLCQTMLIFADGIVCSEKIS